MNKEVDVTIILPTFNRLTFLKKTINSIFNQSLIPGKVLIGNNGSDDGTSEFLNNLSEPNLEIINRKENIGPWPNFDDLLNNVSTKFVAFIGDDDWLGVDFLKNRMEKFYQFPECTLVYGGYTKVDESGHAFSKVTLGEEPLNHFQFAKGCLSHQIFWQSCLFRVNELKTIWKKIQKQNIFDYCLMLEISGKRDLVATTVGNSNDLFVRFHDGSDSNKSLLNTYKITDRYLKNHMNNNLKQIEICVERFHWNLMAARTIREKKLGTGFSHSLEALRLQPLNRLSWISLLRSAASFIKFR